MMQNLSRITGQIQHTNTSGAFPLNPDELIPDIALRALAIGDADRQRGIISEDDQSVLAMYLPDICGELLAFRAAARAGVAPQAFSVFQTRLKTVVQRAAGGRRHRNVSPAAPKPSNFPIPKRG